MDIVRLADPAQDDSYLPVANVLGYSSAIWAERTVVPGDFQIKSYDVDRMMSDLPVGSLISHLETQEVMEVETRSISMEGEGRDAKPYVLIKGRSAQNIFEHRVIKSQYQKKRTLRRQYTAADAAAVLMYNVVNNASGSDVTRGDTNPLTSLEFNDYSWNTFDILPNVAITNSVVSQGAARTWWVEGGPVAPQLLRILDEANLGLRVMRPVPVNPGTISYVRTALADRGEVYKTTYPRIRELRFDIFSGVDRSSEVVFDVRTGDLTGPEYLESRQDYKTLIEIRAGGISIGPIYRAGDYNKTGWLRRTMDFDAGSPEIPDPPERPMPTKSTASSGEKAEFDTAQDEWIDKYRDWKFARADILASFRDSVAESTQKELKARRPVNMFSADASLDTQYQYKSHYNLGDTVRLIGDYGRSSKMIVDEYVRTEDENGDRGFPGFVEP